jgi:zinc transport system substrate-binding protein
MRPPKNIRTGILVVALLGSVSAYGQDRPTVYTVNYPLQYVAERIGGDIVDVVCPATTGEDPAYWIPTTEEVLAYQNADIILLNGADYAGWLNRVTLPPSKMVNTSAERTGDFLAMGAGQAHTHGPGGEHDAHTGWAFTTWLDFDVARSQAAGVLKAFIALTPESEVQFRSNFAHLDKDLMALDSAALELGRRADGRPLLGSHPVYQYLARRYKLNMKSVHWEPDVDPDPTGWRDLERKRGDHKATIMLWEAQPASGTARRLAENGVATVVFDPCASRPPDGDFVSVMRDNLSRLEAALK